ncbi:glycosyltransferase family 4 protein [Chelativorans sp. M5D2P16]|uniref:glycosyltransferase family 4 protein n=1 Tax=Chelativorans sp. M5D2P16 TaxID=3095678 RepID=UPI002ACA07A6|nr:glycosyltransferase family 4 protein [Chelativorans sp. M5D2P16]MDZ5699955.1 glycosyltransferase family 4 protein [Chelativorans sp. M5D2P16]
MPWFSQMLHSNSLAKRYLRLLWRRLPRSARDRLAGLILGKLVPVAAPNQPNKYPVIVVGYLRSASGVGSAARACHDALRSSGIQVFGIDLTARLGTAVDHPAFNFRDGRDVQEGTVLLHVAGLHVPFALLFLGRNYLKKKKVIAHWFWELPRVPRNWNLAARCVHEIWVNTRFVAQAVRPIAGNKPVHVVPYPLKPIHVARRAFHIRPSGHPFTVLVVFNVASNFTRKNPCAAIAAFKQAFDDDFDTRLIVKHARADTWPESLRQMELAVDGAENITLIGDTITDQDMSDLYDQADVVMSLHRSEGLGLILAEAMQREIPVVATNWSGNVDFFDSDVGIPIGFDLVPVEDPQDFYRDKGVVWAEPRINEAVDALRILKADEALRARLGQAAAGRIAAMYSPKQYVRFVRSAFSS